MYCDQMKTRCTEKYGAPVERAHIVHNGKLSSNGLPAHQG